MKVGMEAIGRRTTVLLEVNMGALSDVDVFSGTKLR